MGGGCGRGKSVEPVNGGRSRGAHCGGFLAPWRTGLAWTLHVPEHDAPAVVIVDEVALCKDCAEEVDRVKNPPMPPPKIVKESVRQYAPRSALPPDASDAGVLPDGAILTRRRKSNKGGAQKGRVAALYARDGRRCWYCKKPLRALPLPALTPGSRFPADYPTVDEVIPQSKGGRRVLSNQRVACQPCNNRKGDSILDDAGDLKTGTGAGPVDQPQFGV